MQEFARYVEQVSDKFITAEIQNFTKEGQELRFVLDIQSPEDPEFTRRWEIVMDKLTGMHLDFLLAYEVSRKMNMLIVGNSYVSGRFKSIKPLNEKV